MSTPPNSVKRFIAYFSMEIALENAMPSYSGGLGVLAGDTIRAAADLHLPMVALSLLYRKGYFTQRLAEDGSQTEEPVDWRVDDFLTEEPARASVPIENRRLELRCWRYSVKGVHGFEVPVYFLDADLPSNSEFDRNLTGSLYGGDSYYRLCQEVVLGIGGVRMLRALGYNDLTRFHMNEGHAGLLSLELLGEEAQKAGRTSIRGEDIEKVRGKCVFTTHTPVPAGHDRFPVEYLTRVFPGQLNFFDLSDATAADLVKRILQAEQNVSGLLDAARQGASVNMTQLALSLSTYVNGVAKQHGETSRQMFPEVPIEAITNGVHAGTWTCPAFRQLFDRYIPTWREDNFSLRSALGLPAEDVWAAHLIAKHELLEVVRTKTGLHLDSEVFTVGFARRATGYKRADLILSDLDRLCQIAKDAGQFQMIFADKRHESGAQWCAWPDHFGRRVGRGPHRRRDRLVYRRATPRPRKRRAGRQAGRGGVALFEAREHHPAAVLRRAAQVPRSDAARHRHQRLVFQHAAHGTAVHHRRVSALRLLGRSLCAFLRKKNQQRQFLYRAMPTAASMPILSSAAISRLVLMPPAAMIGWWVASRSVRNHFRFAPIMVPSRSTSVHKKPAQ